MYKISYSKQSVKDIDKLKNAGLDKKAKTLIEIIKQNPYQNPPPYEKLNGNLNEFYSRRINRTHRLVYKIYERENLLKIYSMWTHYEQI